MVVRTAIANALISEEGENPILNKAGEGGNRLLRMSHVNHMDIYTVHGADFEEEREQTRDESDPCIGDAERERDEDKEDERYPDDLRE